LAPLVIQFLLLLLSALSLSCVRARFDCRLRA
jgi:hypothetical protein